MEGDNEGTSSESSGIIDHPGIGSPHSPEHHPVIGSPHPPEHHRDEFVTISETNSEESDHSEGALPAEPEEELVAVPVQVIGPNHEFQIPHRKITRFDFVLWEPWRDLIGFVVGLNDSIRGILVVNVNQIPNSIKGILRILNTIFGWIDEYDTVIQWRTQIERSVNLMSLVVQPANGRAAEEEIFFYFSRSFGNLQIPSYGLHHEVLFMAWLYCLARLGTIVHADYPAIVAKVMIRYREIIRKMTQTFGHIKGVIDPFIAPSSTEFLPYIFGSSELIGHEHMYSLASLGDRHLVSRFSYQTLIFRLVQDRTKGGHNPIPPNMLQLGNMENWDEINRFLLSLYFDMMRRLPLLKKIKSGSLIQLMQ